VIATRARSNTIRPDDTLKKIVSVDSGHTVGTSVITLFDGASGRPSAAPKRNGVFVTNSISNVGGSLIYVGVGDTGQTFTLSTSAHFDLIQPGERAFVPFVEGVTVQLLGSTGSLSYLALEVL
jgi:hypothetical protein